MLLEANEPVDDLVVALDGGWMVFLQAKARLDFGSSMSQVVDQWKRMVERRDFREGPYRLVAACEAASAGVLALGHALERRRAGETAGAMTSAEKRALKRLEILLNDLDVGQREELLNAAVIWKLALADRDGLSARLGQALLEPSVVGPGHGLAAWRLLRDHAHRLAADRRGANLTTLHSLLSAHPLAITSSEAGLASARLEHQRGALAAYRGRIQRAGEQLDLRSLGVRVPPIPIESVDGGVRVVGVDQEHRPGWQPGLNGGISWAVRRRTRALLLGLPGSGKSTTLAAMAAAYARQESWPVPYIVPLTRVSALLSGRHFRDALLDAALEREPAAEQQTLRGIAEDTLRIGNALLLLDGLDEVRGPRGNMIAGLAELLADLHPAVEVVVATRESAFADAMQLGLPELRMVSPTRPLHMAASIVDAAAHTQLGASTEWSSAIAHARVRERLARDAGLGETPLMIVLLALLAVGSDADEPPDNRAEMLRKIAHDVVERWETGVRLRHRLPRLGSLSGTDAVRAAQLSFMIVGDCIYAHGAPLADEVRSAVASMLQEQFGLSAIPADVVAAEAIDLWDEAGIFVHRGRPRVVMSRVRLFAELAAAMSAIESCQPGGWLASKLPEDDTRQVVLLSAGLDRRFADALCYATGTAWDDASRLTLAAEAIRDGIPASSTAVGDLVKAILLEPTDESRRRQELHFRRDPFGWTKLRWHREEARRAQGALLVELPVQPSIHADALTWLDRTMPGREDKFLLVCLRAIAIETWHREDDIVEEDVRELLDLVSTRGSESPQGTLFQRAILAVARCTLQPGDEQRAKLLADAARAFRPSPLSEELRAMVTAAGFPGHSRRIAYGLGIEYSQRERSEAYVDATRRILEMIVGLARPTRLARSDQRRLTQIICLIQASGFESAPEREAIAAVAEAREQLKVLLRVTAERGGLDLGVVAAQAAELLAELDSVAPGDEGPILMLGDGNAELPLGPWEAVTAPEEVAVRLADAVVSPFYWVAESAKRLLDEITEPSAALARDRLIAVLPGVNGRVQERLLATLNRLFYAEAL